jgi:hypothetical protein
MDLVVHKLNVKLTNEQIATANYTSEPFNIQSFSLFCIHFYWENIAFTTLAPTIDVYGSNSLDAPFASLGVGFALSAGNNIAFTTLAPTIDVYGSNSLDAPFASLGVGFALSAGSNSSLLNVEKAGYAYIKIVYNKRDATAGKISAIINAKVI